MLLARLSRRSHSILAVCLVVLVASNAAAVHVPGKSQLGGWVYIDRNNDGQLAFIDDPNPEFVIPNVSISLFSKVGNVETFVSSQLTNPNGRYFFENINPGTYVLKQTQPVEFVDGIDTLGVLQSLNGQPIPPTASPGFVSNNMFSNIVLTPDVGGEFYNFGERGLAAGYASKKYLFASAPPLPPAVPEPATLVLTSIAAAGFWSVSRRRRAR
jgi:hypothetical protein